MPIPIVCPCGKKLKVRDDQAGTRVRCPACKQALSVDECREDLEEEEPEARKPRRTSPESEGEEELDQDEESEEGKASSKKSGSWVKTRCYYCEETTKCKRVHFWSGTTGKVDRKGEFWTGKIKVKLHDLQKHEIYLCRECVGAEWAREHAWWIPTLIGLAALFVICGVLAIPFKETEKWEAFGGSVMMACIALCFIPYFKRKMRNPTFEKNWMENFAVKCAHEEIMENTGNNAFFRTEQLKQMRVK
jgi:hypothetical protein